MAFLILPRFSLLIAGKRCYDRKESKKRSSEGNIAESEKKK